MDTGSSRSRCQQGQRLVRTFSLRCRWPLSHHVLIRRQRPCPLHPHLLSESYQVRAPDWWSHMCMLSCFSRVQLHDAMDHGLPGSSVHGILQARILEWVAISFSKSDVRQAKMTTTIYLKANCDKLKLHILNLRKAIKKTGIANKPIVSW